jgi:hypothetical protein
LLHQVGDLFQLNVKLRYQKIKFESDYVLRAYDRQVRKEMKQDSQCA